MAALLVPVLVMGGFGVAQVMTSGTAASTQHAEALPTPVPGVQTPGADDPVTPPDRASDQTGVPAHADKIYYIQEGDTLTQLSAKFGMSVDYIAKYNAVRNVDIISRGAVLRMPYIYEPPALSGSTKTPAVRRR